MENFEEILGSVEQYYSDKLKTHGAVPKGVDWKDKPSQVLRFEQLLKVCPTGKPYSLNDVGCGFGCLVESLPEEQSIEYHGADISAPMIEAAKAKFAGRPHTHFYERVEDLPVCAYSVASGIFNVRLKHEAAAWESYIENVLESIHAMSTRGFAFNMLTSYSDADKMRPDLYYADPGRYFDLCKRRFSRNVALLHDYGLYEFTLLVRKDI